MEIVAGRVCMTGVETDSDAVFLFDAVKYLTDLLELRTHTVTGAGHVLQADLETAFRMLCCLVEGVADSLESDLSSHSYVAAQVRDQVWDSQFYTPVNLSDESVDRLLVDFVLGTGKVRQIWHV